MKNRIDVEKVILENYRKNMVEKINSGAFSGYERKFLNTLSAEQKGMYLCCREEILKHTLFSQEELVRYTLHFIRSMFEAPQDNSVIRFD